MASTSIDNYRLEWLTSFLAVVDHGGFAAAAEATFRSQPRVSAHIAELERQLGALLFDRRERPVRLTEAGMAFLEHARRVVSDLEAGTTSVRAVIGLLRGRVRIGWYPSAGATFGPGVLHQFSELHPGVTVALLEARTADLATALRNGEIDIAIRPLLPETREPTLQHHVLWEEPLVVLVPEGHELASHSYISLAELGDRPIVTIGSDLDGDRGDEVQLAFVKAGITPRIVQRTNDPLTLVGFVRVGLGLGLTNLLAATATRHEGLRIIPLKDAGNRRQVCVFWDSSYPLTPASRALIDLIAQSPAPEAVHQYQRRA